MTTSTVGSKRKIDLATASIDDIKVALKNVQSRNCRYKSMGKKTELALGLAEEAAIRSRIEELEGTKLHKGRTAEIVGANDIDLGRLIRNLQSQISLKSRMIKTDPQEIALLQTRLAKAIDERDGRTPVKVKVRSYTEFETKVAELEVMAANAKNKREKRDIELIIMGMKFMVDSPK